jgi:hypothetical protein
MSAANTQIRHLLRTVGTVSAPGFLSSVSNGNAIVIYLSPDFLMNTRFEPLMRPGKPNSKPPAERSQGKKDASFGEASRIGQSIGRGDFFFVAI